MPTGYTPETARASQALSVRARRANRIATVISQRLTELLTIAGESANGPDIARAVADNPALILRAIQSGDDALCYRIWHDCYEFVHGRAAQTHLVAAQIEVRMSESTAARVRELAARFTTSVSAPESTTDTPGTESTKS